MNHGLRFLSPELRSRHHEFHELRSTDPAHVEIGTRSFGERRRRERPELLSKLYALVDNVAHFGGSRGRKDAAVAQRSRSELHATTKPAYHLAANESIRDHVLDVIGVLEFDFAAVAAKSLNDATFAVARAQAHRRHRPARRRVPEHLVMDVLRGAYARSLVPRRGKDVGFSEHPRAGHSAGHHLVEGNAAGEANSMKTVFVLQIRDATKHGVLEAFLQRSRDIHLVLGDRRCERSRRPEKILDIGAEVI